MQYAFGNVLSQESAQHLEKLYSLSICLKIVTVSPDICLKEILPLLFPVKTSPFTAWPEQPVSLRWLMITECPLQKTCSWRGKLAPPTFDGRGSILITTGERKKQGKQHLAGC